MNSPRNLDTPQLLSAENWAFGAYLPAAGSDLVSGRASGYEDSHPGVRRYPREKGGVARHYRWIYVARGGGRLETHPGGIHELETGDLFIVFPEVWHRCQPDQDSGWDKYWVDLGGDFVRRLMHHPCFSPKHPVLRLGADTALRELFMKAVEMLDRQPVGFQFLTGALGIQIVAQTLAALKARGLTGGPVENVVQEAKELLTWPEFAEMRLERFAAHFNLSYSTFRRVFKEQTGVSPRQYALDACGLRAKDLLLRTDKPIHLIAKELGFVNVPYFSRFFKKKTGLSPSEMRRHVIPLPPVSEQGVKPPSGPTSPDPASMAAPAG